MFSVSFIGEQRIDLTKVDSTNSYAQKLIEKGEAFNGQLISTSYQSGGKGQRGKTWESEASKNVLLSVILKPVLLPISSQFILNKFLTLAIYDTVRELLPQQKVSIKWPNDILVDSKKIAGLLVENLIRIDKIEWSISGIGINVNQHTFKHYSPAATSILLETGIEHEVEDIIKILIKNLNNWQVIFTIGKYNTINNTFDQALLGFGKYRMYEVKDGCIEGKIAGTDEIGNLIIQLQSGETINFSHGDVKFIFE